MDQLECWFTAIIWFHLVVIVSIPSSQVSAIIKDCSRSSPSKSPQITTLAAISHFLLNNSAACGVVKKNCVSYKIQVEGANDNLCGSQWRMKAKEAFKKCNWSAHGASCGKFQVDLRNCLLKDFMVQRKFYVANKFKLFFSLVLSLPFSVPVSWRSRSCRMSFS